MPRELGDLVDADTGRLYYNVDVTYTRVAVNRWMRYTTREPQSRKPMGLNFSQATKDPLQKPLAKMWGASLSPEQVPKTMGQDRDPPILANSHPFPRGKG